MQADKSSVRGTSSKMGFLVSQLTLLCLETCLCLQMGHHMIHVLSDETDEGSQCRLISTSRRVPKDKFFSPRHKSIIFIRYIGSSCQICLTDTNPTSVQNIPFY